MRFSEWLLQRENVVSDAISGTYHKVIKATKIAAHAIKHPAQIPQDVEKLIVDEWHNLVQKYGTNEAILILSSLVIALGPGLLVPGSMVLVWVTIGVCKLFNSVVKTVQPHDEHKLNQEQVDAEVTRLKDELMKVAEMSKRSD